jgi:hypothetical protein
VPNVQWKTPDDGQRNYPKHVEFLDKNKFGKLVISVGLIKKKFGYDTQSNERKIPFIYIKKELSPSRAKMTAYSIHFHKVES